MLLILKAIPKSISLNYLGGRYNPEGKYVASRGFMDLTVFRIFVSETIIFFFQAHFMHGIT